MSQRLSGYLVPLAVLGLLGYGAYRYGWPAYQERFGTSGGNPTDCAALTRRALQAFEAQIVSFAKPPYDRAAWGAVRAEMTRRIGEANSACRCPNAACRTGDAALDEMRSLVDQVDASVKTGATPEIETESILRRVRELVDRAESEQRQGP